MSLTEQEKLHPNHAKSQKRAISPYWSNWGVELCVLSEWPLSLMVTPKQPVTGLREV